LTTYAGHITVNEAELQNRSYQVSGQQKHDCGFT